MLTPDSESGLLQALNDPSDGVVEKAAFALSAPELLTPEAVNKLTHLLTHTVTSVRKEAAFALACVTQAPVDLPPVLRERLLDEKENAYVRANAARAYWKITGDTVCTLPVLTVLLQEQTVRGLALNYLGEMGPTAQPVVPIIEKIQEQWKSDPIFSEDLANVLKRIKQERPWP